MFDRRAQSDAPLRPDIYGGETKIETVTVSTPRQDAVTAPKGDGAHGFFISTPVRPRDDQPHSIRHGFSGTDFHLNKSNQPQVTCPAS